MLTMGWSKDVFYRLLCLIFFINDLICDICDKSLDIGKDIDNEKVGILLYADDIVLMGEI